MNDFLSFIASVFQVPAEELSPETEFQVYEKWDSLMHLRLVMEIENEYDIEIPIEEVPNIKTLSDFYKYLEQ